MNVPPPFHFPYLGNVKAKGWSADQPSTQAFYPQFGLEIWRGNNKSMTHHLAM